MVRQGEGCFVAAKPKPKQEDLLGSPRRRPTFTEAKMFLKGETTLHRGKGRKQQKTTLRFASTKDVFLAHLWPIFHLRINICILDLMRVRFWKKNTLLRVSPLFFLSHSRVFDFVPFLLWIWS